MKISTTALAVAAAAVAMTAPMAANAQRDVDDVLSLLQREFEHSSEVLDEMWQNVFGRFEQDNYNKEDTNSVRVIVVDVANEEDQLTDDEKMLACRVAVKRVEEQAQLKQETERLTARLRSPKSEVVAVHYMDETTCESLSRPLMMEECNRVMALDKEIEIFLGYGKKDEEICGSLVASKDEVDAPTPLSCKLCKRFVQMVSQAIEQDMAQVQQVREILGDLCDSMAVDSMCHTFIKHYDDVVNWIKHGTDPDVVCARLTMCPVTPQPQENNTEALAVVEQASVRDDTHGCFYCTHISGVVGFVAEHAPDQLDTLRSVIKYVCKLTPKGCKCDEAEKNYDTIVNLTKQGKSPKEICEAIHMCKKTDHGDDTKLVALVSGPAAVEKVSSLLLSMASPFGVRNDNKCFYCEYFTTLLEVALQEDKQDMDQIRQYADIVCGMLGDANQCHQYVDKLDYVVDALENGKKPRDICIGLKFCAATTTTTPAIAAAASKALETQGKHSTAVVAVTIDNCFFCTQLAALFKVVLAQDEKQIDEIRMIADLVCKALPTANQCHLVMKEVDEIIDSLKKGEEPAAICHDLKFCLKDSFQSVVLAKPIQSNKCAYCDGVATVLEYALKAKADQVQQVREAAGLVCDFMPEDDKCHDDLKMFDKAVADLKAGKSPHAICAELNYCKATTESKLTPLAISKLDLLDAETMTIQAIEKQMSMGCLLCEYTAEVLTLVDGDTTELRLAKKSLETMCMVLPPSAKCDVISFKFDTLVTLVGEDKKSPSEACHSIGVCDAAFVEPRAEGSIVEQQ